jgi:hypothetical protein
VIEPRGSRGPDIESDNGELVGEIKHAKELARDLRKKFWADWNSSQSFGGKTNDYRLACEFSNGAASVRGEAQGWLAVIYGQLNYYRRTNRLSEGWLVYEEPGKYLSSIQDAAAVMKREDKVRNMDIEEVSGLGFCRVIYAD